MKIVRAYLVAGVMMMGAAGAQAQTGDEIISKHIEAVGGSNWDKIKSMKLTGSLNAMGMEVPVTQTTVNNKGTRMDISVMGMSGYTITTDKEGWIYMPFQPGMDKVTPMPKEQVEMAKSQLSLKNLQLADKAEIGKAEYIGRDTIDGVPAYKLKLSKDGNDQIVFFDAKTYYLLRTLRTIAIQDQEQEMAVTFSNFQKQPEGIVVAMGMTTPQGDITFKSIEVNKVYDDALFKPSATDKK